MQYKLLAVTETTEESLGHQSDLRTFLTSGILTLLLLECVIAVLVHSTASPSLDRMLREFVCSHCWGEAVTCYRIGFSSVFHRVMILNFGSNVSN